ncbi:AMP-binding protein [Streptomyces sp. NPDC091272]|uniref:AMP-binding protein n=1 Tax=Streptomyces sp. NPDC091272 TaxID=3365981 RepID=UPI00382CA77E
MASVLGRWEGDSSLAHRYVAADHEVVEVSRSALLGAARGRAEALARSRVLPGDRVALVAQEPAPFVAAFLGALWAGMVPVPLPPPPMGCKEGWQEEIAAALDVVQPTVLAASEEHLRLLPRVRPLFLAYEQLDVVASGVVPAAPFDPERVAYLQFSSGSTGRPRAVAATCASVTANALGIMGALRAGPERDHGVSWLPLHHDMGLVGFVLAPLTIGLSVSLMAPSTFIRDPGLWMRTMSRTRGTITAAPNFAYALAARRSRPQDVAELDLSAVHSLLCGGEPVNKRSLEHFTAVHGPAGLDPASVRCCYGLAEATLAVTFTEPGVGVVGRGVSRSVLHEQGRAQRAEGGEPAVEVVSCGRPLPGHEVLVADGGAMPCAAREVGEVWVRGPSVARGYVGDNAATTETFGRDGWLRTGDRGYLDDDGDLYVTGRSKDVLVVNGRNVDPQHVEWLVETVAGVRPHGAVAFTRPGVDTEEVVVLAVCGADRAAELAGRVRELVARRLSLHVADVVAVAPGAVARTTSGKPRRQQMRARYLATRAASAAATAVATADAAELNGSLV